MEQKDRKEMNDFAVMSSINKCIASIVVDGVPRELAFETGSMETCIPLDTFREYVMVCATNMVGYE